MSGIHLRIALAQDFREPDIMEAIAIICVLAAIGFGVARIQANQKRQVRQAITPKRTADRPTIRPDAKPIPRSQPEPFNETSASPPTQRTTLNGAAYVVDGDTIRIQKTQIRLYGIDAPELDHPFGQKSKWAMVRLCKGQQIRAEVTDVDSHGRTVAKCYLPDGRDLSAELVKLGLAIDWPKYSGGVYKTLEVPGIRKKLWLADARQKGRLHVWEQFEAKQKR